MRLHIHLASVSRSFFRAALLTGVATLNIGFASLVVAEPSANIKPSTLDSELLAQLSVSAQNIKSMTGRFVQNKKVQGIPLELESSGEFEYSKDNGVIMRTLKPLVSRLDITKSGVRYEQSSEILPGSDMLAETLLGVFTGDLSGLTQYFTLLTQGTANDWVIELRPLNEAIAGQVQGVTVSGKAFTERVNIIDGMGDTTTLALQVLGSELFDELDVIASQNASD